MAVETLSLGPKVSVPHGTWIEVRLDRILKNLEQIRKVAGPSVGVMAVVKANAYGHGLVPVSKALEGKADYLGIASLREASILREQGVTLPLLVFGRLHPDEISAALSLKLTLTVSSFEEAEAISEAGTRFGQTVPVHIKVDTGMGRLGLPFLQAEPEIKRIWKLPSLLLEGLYTHFPTAERREDPFGEAQLENFERLIQTLEDEGIHFPLRHAFNSAGALRFKSKRLNLIRPGIALYGVYPDRIFEDVVQLEPALSLKTRIAFLKQLQPGDSVSYGREFIAARPTTIGVLPVGYSHGYPFQLSNLGEVLYRGKRRKIAGRVCMDWTMIDLGADPSVRVGDEVTLLGSEGGESVGAQRLASWAQTIPYEILTRLEPGIPRFYHPL